VKIERATVYLLRLPLVQSYNHYAASRSYTDNIVVRLQSEGLTGYGEGVPRSYVTGEGAQSAFEVMERSLADVLSPRTFSDIRDVKRCLSDWAAGSLWKRNPAAFCALELALLDLSSRCWDCSLEGIFGFEWNQPPPYSAVIPLLPPDRLDPFLSLVREHEMRTIKLKVGNPVDFAVFERIFAVLGTDLDLRVDANGAWTQDEALRNIDKLRRYKIRAIEQPVAKEDFEGLKKVTAASGALIIADESVCSIEDARKLCEMKACHAFNVRISKCGGLLASQAVADIGRQGGLRVQLGCQVGETGILSAAGRHLAGWLPDLLYLEGSFGTWALQEDVVEEDIRFGKNGEAPPLTGKGLGVHVREETLERYATDVATLII